MAVTLHTSHGNIKLELFVDDAPKTCANFLALCASEKYNSTKFHRNIKQFMIQGGDPTGTGKGGTSIWGTPFSDEFSPALRHNHRGTVSMANKGPNTNQSQFFITYADSSPHLDDVFPVFGRVIHGLQVLDLMERELCDDKNRSLKPITINTVTIHANPFAERAGVLFNL